MCLINSAQNSSKIKPPEHRARSTVMDLIFNLRTESFSVRTRYFIIVIAMHFEFCILRIFHNLSLRTNWFIEYDLRAILEGSSGYCPGSILSRTTTVLFHTVYFLK